MYSLQHGALAQTKQQAINMTKGPSVNIKKKMWCDCQWENSPQETKWHRN